MLREDGYQELAEVKHGLDLEQAVALIEAIGAAAAELGYTELRMSGLVVIGRPPVAGREPV